MGGLRSLRSISSPSRSSDSAPRCWARYCAGGCDVITAAGAMLVGGHSIDDPEPKYGLAVTGVVHPDEVLTNAGGRAGDVLVLTKPLGVGAVTAALKRGAAGASELGPAVECMTTSNAAASLAARAAAVTDVTGFGLLGHLHELVEASGLAAELDASAVPVLRGVQELLSGEDAVSGGSRRNRAHAETFTRFEDGVPEWRLRRPRDKPSSTWRVGIRISRSSSLRGRGDRVRLTSRACCASGRERSRPWWSTIARPPRWWRSPRSQAAGARWSCRAGSSSRSEVLSGSQRSSLRAAPASPRSEPPTEPGWRTTSGRSDRRPARSCASTRRTSARWASWSQSRSSRSTRCRFR